MSAQQGRGNGNCETTRHCVTWGFCHRCNPELSEKVQKEWNGGDDGAYAKLVIRIAREMG